METIPCQHSMTVQKPRTQRGFIMDKYCNHENCKKLLQQNIFPATTFEGFIRRWVHNKLTAKDAKGRKVTQVSCDKYSANDHGIFYNGSGRNITYGTDTLAIRLKDGRVMGNASRLPRCGSFRKGAEAPAQRVMQQLEMPLIPFNVFDEAKLDITSAEVIHQGKTEKLLLPKLFWDKGRGELIPMHIWKTENSLLKPEGKDLKNLRQEKVYIDGKYQDGWSHQVLKKDILEKRHFIGAMVLRVLDGEKHRYYLFDVDRKELPHYRFNAFLSELPKPCKNIEEAYDMLMPREVKMAIRSGLDVERQGEWFFISAKLPKPVKADEESKRIAAIQPKPKRFDLPYWRGNRPDEEITPKEVQKHIDECEMGINYMDSHRKRVDAFNEFVRRYVKALRIVHREDPEKYAIRGELRAGQNRPNNVEKYVSLPEGIFVKGCVTHSGREHEPVDLEGWYKPVPNTAIASFTIQGAID